MLKLMKENKPMAIYFLILAFTALALGLTNDVLSNYFKDAYNVSTYQRGIIEFPRELPGVLVIVVVSCLSFISDFRIAMVAQILSIIGITVLGLITPTFNIMLIFLFINSLGMHLFFPLQDSIGMSLMEENKIGERMGQYKGISTGFSMFGAIIIFIGFRSGWFSFTTEVKWVFLIAAVLLFVVLLLFITLEKALDHPIKRRGKIKLFFRKEYKYYYVLVVMYGVQKQIMMVYGPWVLIELLGKKVDTLALLSIIGAFIGIFFIPAVGRGMDYFGVKKLLYADALSFIGVYLVYGLLSSGFATGKLIAVGVPVVLTYILFIVDKMSNQLGMVRSIYLKTIILKDSDLMPTLSLGISLDHIASIICAVLGGIVWTMWGPQYIFFFAAALSLVNLYVAKKVEL